MTDEALIWQEPISPVTVSVCSWLHRSKQGSSQLKIPGSHHATKIQTVTHTYTNAASIYTSLTEGKKKKKKRQCTLKWCCFKIVKSKLTFPNPWEVFITWVPMINQQVDAQCLWFKLREKLETSHCCYLGAKQNLGMRKVGTQHFIYQQISGVVAISRREEPKPSNPQLNYLQIRQTRLQHPWLLPQPVFSLSRPMQKG